MTEEIEVKGGGRIIVPDWLAKKMAESQAGGVEPQEGKPSLLEMGQQFKESRLAEKERSEKALKLIEEREKEAERKLQEIVTQQLLPYLDAINEIYCGGKGGIHIDPEDCGADSPLSFFNKDREGLDGKRVSNYVELHPDRGKVEKFIHASLTWDRQGDEDWDKTFKELRLVLCSLKDGRLEVGVCPGVSSIDPSKILDLNKSNFEPKLEEQLVQIMKNPERCQVIVRYIDYGTNHY